MKKQVYKINESGYFIEPVILNESDSVPNDCTEIAPPNGYYTPQFNGEIWIEGATLEEIEIIKNAPKSPSKEDRLDALEKAMLEIVLGGVNNG